MCIVYSCTLTYVPPTHINLFCPLISYEHLRGRFSELRGQLLHLTGKVRGGGREGYSISGCLFIVVVNKQSLIVIIIICL